MLGLTFVSFWDNNTAIDPVTNYSIWRHLDASGSGIGSIEEGNWELVGEAPAQGFAAYGYQAPRWATPTSLANSIRATL